MSPIKPIHVWGQIGPNPPKVPILLIELGLPYEITPMPLSDVKNPEYVKINPNGRIPAIHDPNTNITLWETGAIIEYLIERYDTEHKIGFPPGTVESYHAKQWLFFQTTGQGPYYGQANWFKKFHSEKLPSATERYVKEVNRVTGVLEGQLARQKTDGGDGPWLVGNKFSFADLAFVPYQKIIVLILDKEEFNQDNYPLVKDWVDRMSSRQSVDTVFKEMYAAMQGEHK